MREIAIVEAASRLPELVENMQAGDEIVLVRDGRGVARLTPIAEARPIRLGIIEGQFRIPDDFDAPLPDEILDLFEGR